MDTQTLAAAIAKLNGAMATVPSAYTYQGSVATVDDLPESATQGDLYTVSGDQYVYDGTDWVKVQAGVDLTDYAKIDGAYEGMTVGNAEELVTGLEGEEFVPFIFRTSGGHLEIGSREDLTVVGGSLAWNQLAKYASPTQTLADITFTNNNDGTYTVNGTATGNASLNTNYGQGFALRPGGIYFVSGCPSGGSAQTYFFGVGGLPNDTGNGSVWKNTPNYATGAPNIVVKSGTTVNNLVFRPQIIDLVQLFGSTIADYIYSLEQNTAGAGVAFFKKLFPKSYYPYNAGELLSVNASAFKTVGFNAYNAETHTAKVLGGIEYKIEGAYTSLSLTDIDGNISTITPSSGLFTPNANGTITVTGYDADTCIFIHWDNTRDGEYEPYVEHGYALDSDLTLRGIPKLDADNNLYYDGDTYASDGTVTRKYGIVDLGTLNWTYDSGEYWRFRADLPSLALGSLNLFCTRYETDTANHIYLHTKDKTIGSHSSVHQMWVYDTAYTNASATEFKTAMSGVYLVYELATPTTESADAYQKPQIVDNWGTEEFTVTEQSGVAVPVGHDTIYPISLRDKLEAMPNLPSEDGAYILRMRSGEPAYIALANEFPAPPTTDGTYTLQATVSSGAATLTWEEVNA